MLFHMHNTACNYLFQNVLPRMSTKYFIYKHPPCSISLHLLPEPHMPAISRLQHLSCLEMTLQSLHSCITSIYSTSMHNCTFCLSLGPIQSVIILCTLQPPHISSLLVLKAAAGANTKYYMGQYMIYMVSVS